MARNERQWLAPPQLPRDHFVDSRIYSSPEIFQEEMTKVRQQSWKFACHESEIPNSFDFRTIEHAGYSLILRRGGDGGIRAFVNLCSHRGAPVVREPAGNARIWTCYFHQWTYDAANGNCTNITRPSGYQECGLTKEKVGLREVRSAVRCGLVFVNLSDDAPSFDDYIGDALELAQDVLGAAPFEVFHYHRSVIRANWKMWHETNMEAYHEFLHYVNRNVAMGGTGYFDRKWRLYPNGHGALEPMVQKYERIPGLDSRQDHILPGLNANEFRALDLYPDTSILIRTTVIRIDTSTPLGPDHTLVECRGLGLRNEDDAVRQLRRKHHNQFWGPFGRNIPEDGLAIEALTAGARGAGLPYPVIARREDQRVLDDCLLRAFYAQWGRQMGRCASAPFETRTRLT